MHLNGDQDEANAEESFTNIELANAANYMDSQLAYHSRNNLDNQNLFLEQTLQSTLPAISLANPQSANGTSRDCLQPYRFPRCKFHHKKNRHRTSASPPAERVDNDIEHSIVVVADVPVDNFEKMLEDVV